MSGAVEMLAIARWLVNKRGFSVIPLDHPAETTQTDPRRIGKVPAVSWKSCQARRATDVILRVWFTGRQRNLGIVTGAVSNIVVVDCDSPKAIGWADAQLPPTPMITRTAKGEHRYYRHPGGIVHNAVRIRTGDPRVKIDIRADGGYVVAPGSVHASGSVYERVGSWPSVATLPIFDRAWLEPEKPAAPAGEARQLLRVPEPTDWTDRDRLIRRARAYLATTAPAIEGQGGDAHTFVVACRLVRDFGLDAADAFALLSEWNQRCIPPWAEAEMQTKIQNATAYGNGSIGGKIDKARATAGATRRRPADAEAAEPATASGHVTAAPDVPLILDPGNPLPSARAFVSRWHLVDGVLALRHWAGLFYAHVSDMSAYAVRDEAAIRADLYALLEGAQRWSEPKGNQAPTLGPFKPTKGKIENALDALRAVCNLPASCAAPCWLQEDLGLDPFDILPCRNGLLHIPTRELLPATATFFALNGLNFAYEPAAPHPTHWLNFLLELWPDDQESRDTLQEAIGYLLTPRTHFQKIFMLVGPKRSGKGTVGRVVRRLLGDRNVCGPTLANMSEQFGLSVLIGKSAAIIADARISGRTDTAVITERLLSISGEDTLSIARKYLSDWNGKLSTRFLLLTNELPNIEDASGALASRFIVLMLRQSFYGHEDHGLFDRFVPELPGILNWALEGWERLYARGRFVQPRLAASLIQEFEDLGSPIGAFLRDRCEVCQGYDVPKDRLFKAWKTWCDENGRERPGTVQTFGRNLRAAMPWLGESQPRVLGVRVRYYEGIRLREGDE